MGLTGLKPVGEGLRQSRRAFAVARWFGEQKFRRAAPT